MYRTEETAATIPAGEYVARYRNAEKFIVFCQACSRYGACWACPPHGFDADEYLSGYRTALIIGTRIIPEPSARAECATPEQGRQAGQRMIVEVRRTLDARLLELEPATCARKGHAPGAKAGRAAIPTGYALRWNPSVSTSGKPRRNCWASN